MLVSLALSQKDSTGTYPEDHGKVCARTGITSSRYKLPRLAEPAPTSGRPLDSPVAICEREQPGRAMQSAEDSRSSVLTCAAAREGARGFGRGDRPLLNGPTFLIQGSSSVARLGVVDAKVC